MAMILIQLMREFPKFDLRKSLNKVIYTDLYYLQSSNTNNLLNEAIQKDTISNK